MKTTNKALRGVDDEFRAADKELREAKKRLEKAAAARERAHRLEELKKSAQMRSLQGLSDEEWKALRQHIDNPTPVKESLTHDPASA